MKVDNSANITDSNWCSVHLFYNASFNELLKTGVTPFIDEIDQKGYVEKFFFIRYNENGPHIRLRMKGLKLRENERFIKFLEGYFINFFNKYPSPEISKKSTRSINNHGHTYPMNSIQYIEYKPETERYGGEVGVDIAESLFEASSRSVLNILSRNNINNYGDILGYAVKLHLPLLFSFRLKENDVSNFFDLVYNSWLPSANYFIRHRLKTREISADSIVDIFNESFLPIEEEFSDYCEQYWIHLQEKTEFLDQWLNDWIRDLNEIAKLFFSAYDRNEIISPSVSLNLPNLKPEWNIFASYIHMTNNRLGLTNYDEVYVAFILMRTFKTLFEK